MCSLPIVFVDFDGSNVLAKMSKKGGIEVKRPRPITLDDDFHAAVKCPTTGTRMLFNVEHHGFRHKGNNVTLMLGSGSDWYEDMDIIGEVENVS